MTQDSLNGSPHHGSAAQGCYKAHGHVTTGTTHIPHQHDNERTLYHALGLGEIQSAVANEASFLMFIVMHRNPSSLACIARTIHSQHLVATRLLPYHSKNNAHNLVCMLT